MRGGPRATIAFPKRYRRRHSLRNVTAGSSRAARFAGSKLASAATAASNAATLTKAGTSMGRTPTARLVRAVAILEMLCELLDDLELARQIEPPGREVGANRLPPVPHQAYSTPEIRPIARTNSSQLLRWAASAFLPHGVRR